MAKRGDKKSELSERISEYALDKRLEFLDSLNEKGVDIGSDRIKLLQKHGYISTPIDSYEPSISHKINRALNKDYTVKHKSEVAADSLVDIEVNSKSSDKDEVVTYQEYSEKSRQFKYKGKKNVETSEWMPDTKEILNYPKDFVQWIDSINTGFDNMIPYSRFRLYVHQANMWLAENRSYSDYSTRQGQINFARGEKKRCTDNSLYFLNKYHVLKEGDIASGGRRFHAWDCQQVICFLFDCGYNMLIGKPRQIGFTSTFGGLCEKRIVFHKSYFVKFITKSLLKGQEIFEDKVKFPFYHLPEWMRPTVHNDRDNLLRLFYRPSKGEIGGVDSKLEVVAPSVTAINGGAPNLVAIDEVGLIDILGKMINEGRPALFWVDEDKKIRMRRQLIAWGTGGEMSGGGREFEVEFQAARQAWKERNFHYGIIPIFFDAFAKPGVDEFFYEKEKKFYYAKGPESSIQFHQHYPTTMDDMFLVSSETIVPIETINARIKKIQKLKPLDKPKYGYFEPLYDYGKRASENSDVPYEISGAVFMPTEDGDSRATTIMFEHPEENWSNRYFQGTDPVYTETGHSMMSSAIWDNVTGTVSACMNYRERDYRYCYLQSLLLGIYYDKESTRNLIESNVGSGYMDYIDTKGYFRTIVPNKMLSPHLRTTIGQSMGINKKGNTARFILNKLQEMLEVYGENIFIEEFWIQLKTYVRKMSSSGNESFKIENSKYYYDDVIDAVVYSYICGQSFSHLTPIEPEAKRARKVKYRYSYDGNFNLQLKKVLV